MHKQILQNIKKYGNLPSLLKELRVEKGYSIQALSTALNISTTSLQNYEKGDTFPNESNLTRILDFFELDPSSLMSDSYAKTYEIKDLLNEEYFTIQHRIEILKDQISYYQQLADDIKMVIDTTETDDSLNPTLTYNDENYQNSGLGDTFLEKKLYLEEGRYRLKGYFKPAKSQRSSTLTIDLIEIENSSRYNTIRLNTPYQPFSKILKVYHTGHYNINVECSNVNKWAFSILPT